MAVCLHSTHLILRRINLECRLGSILLALMFAAIGCSDESIPTTPPSPVQESITLTSQAQVDSFSLSAVSGTLIISGEGITNLDGLAGLTFVGGSLSIGNDDVFHPNSLLRNIDGLAGVTSVGGDLWIIDNTVLTNVDGLAGITSVGGEMWIAFNGALTNVDGLAGITSMGGGLRIHDNDALSRCCGLVSILGVLALENVAIWNNQTGCNSAIDIFTEGPCP